MPPGRYCFPCPCWGLQMLAGSCATMLKRQVMRGIKANQQDVYWKYSKRPQLLPFLLLTQTQHSSQAWIPGSFHSGIVLILATPPGPEPLNPARPLRVTFPSFLPCKPLEGTKPPPAPWARPCRPEPGLRRLRPSRESRRLHCCTPHTSSPAGLNQVNSTAVRHLRQESYMIYSS